MSVTQPKPTSGTILNSVRNAPDTGRLATVHREWQLAARLTRIADP